MQICMLHAVQASAGISVRQMHCLYAICVLMSSQLMVRSQLFLQLQGLLKAEHCLS